MFAELPLELMMAIFKFVDSDTVMSLSLDGLKRKGFFSFLSFEEKFWAKIIRKEIGPCPREFDLPLNILVEEQVVERYENNSFFRYLLLSKCQERLREEAFLLSSYQGKYYLLSGNLVRDKFLTFQLEIPPQNCRLFNWKEQPLLKGKIFLQGKIPSDCSLTVRGRMPMSEEGITVQINWKCNDARVTRRYNPKTQNEESFGDIYFTFISKNWGPKFPISSMDSYRPIYISKISYSTPKMLNREEFVLTFFGNGASVNDIDNYTMQNCNFFIEVFSTMVKSVTQQPQ